MSRSLASLVLLLSVALLAGCATPATKVATVDRLEAGGERNPSVLLMAPDVRMYLLTASGMAEPQAEWTSSAQQNFTDAAVSYSQAREVDLLLMPEGMEPDETGIALERLHAAVGNAIMMHHFGELKLPSKAGAFDWTLGTEAASIGERHDADYALFTYYRDYRASGGRVGMMVLFAAAGVAIPMGGSFGFASLVDLRTGDIVWFNQLPMGGGGDPRNGDGATRIVDNLLNGLPGR